jgi:hypothetical protein
MSSSHHVACLEFSEHRFVGAAPGVLFVLGFESPWLLSFCAGLAPVVTGEGTSAPAFEIGAPDQYSGRIFLGEFSVCAQSISLAMIFCFACSLVV